MKVLTALVVAITLAPTVEAQQPTLFLQYDGFKKNPDGSYLLAFDYYNATGETITLAPGVDNAFLPDPVDRGQITTFRPGRHRVACVMLVGPDFDGKLQWRTNTHGTPSLTTTKTLEPVYEIEESMLKRSLEGIDLGKSPRGVCINHPPWLLMAKWMPNPKATGRSLDAYRVSIDERLTLEAQVDDDGLPRGSTVNAGWKKVSGPGAVKLDTVFGENYMDHTINQTVTTDVKFDAPGEYELELAASDGTLTSRLSVHVTVTVK